MKKYITLATDSENFLLSATLSDNKFTDPCFSLHVDDEEILYIEESDWLFNTLYNHLKSGDIADSPDATLQQINYFLTLTSDNDLLTVFEEAIRLGFFREHKRA